MYRRNRRLVLTQDDTDGLDAVRVNIPLSRVITVEKSTLVSFAGLVTVTFDPKSSNSDLSTEQPASSTEDKEAFSLLDTGSEKQVLKFGILRHELEWDNVLSNIDKAKTAASSDNVDWPGSRVFLDVDPRTNETSETSDNNLSDVVKSVTFALGLDATKEIWSTFCPFSSSLPPHIFL